MAAGERYRVNSPSIVSEVLDGEGVMINLDTGTYYSASGVGGAIWSLLEAGAHAGEIEGWLRSAWGDQPGLAEDVAAYIRRVVEEKLVVPDPTRAAPALPPPAPRKEAYAKPVIEVFKDMQDLLLADPIHDVDETGWPHRPDDAPR